MVSGQHDTSAHRPGSAATAGLVLRAAARYMPPLTCPPEAALLPRRLTVCRLTTPFQRFSRPCLRFLLPLSREGKCMTRCLPVLCVALLWTAPVRASGFLIPTDSATPPLAMVSHHVEAR